MSNPTLLTTDSRTKLLFKNFMGVATTNFSGFQAGNFNHVPNIFSKDVMIEEIPDIPPILINDLDSSLNWIDSSSNYNINLVQESTFFNQADANDPNNGKTFAEMYPDSNLKFYKKLHLVPVESFSGNRVWGSFTDVSGQPTINKNSVLEHCIPFKYDDIEGGYLPKVYRNQTASSGPSNQTWVSRPLNTSPEFWLMDAGSGYLLFYQENTVLSGLNINATEKLSTNIQNPLYAPRISCYVYNGKTGITNLDVSGQVQVSDLSGALGSIGNIDRMILVDGSANVLDLNDGDAIRSQYNYVRKNMFIGYSTQPIIDNSNVDHTQDPSLNNVFYELDVSGNSLLNGTLSVTGNVDISGTLDVIGKTTLTDVSTNNVTVNNNLDVSGNTDISGTLDVIGKTTLTDVSTNFVTVNDNLDVSGNVDISGTLDVFGHTRLRDVSASNVTIDEFLDVNGSARLKDISAINLSLSGNLVVDGKTTFDDAEGNDVKLNQTLNVVGKSTLTDVSATAITTTENIWVGGDMKAGGIIDSFGGTRFVDYKYYDNNDISGSQYINGAWHCIATLDPALSYGTEGAYGSALFIIDDDTSGKRQMITFRVGSAYSKGEFIDVVSNNWYASLSNSNGSGCPITKIKITHNDDSFYSGANLYIFRRYVAAVSNTGGAVNTTISIRTYQNRRSASHKINYWQLKTTPITFSTPVTGAEIDIVYNEVQGGSAGRRACKVSTLDTMITGDVSFNNLTTSDYLTVNGDITANGDTILKDTSITGHTQVIDLSATTIETDTLITNNLVNTTSTTTNFKAVRVDASSVYIQDSNMMQYMRDTTITLSPPSINYFSIAFIDLGSLGQGCASGYFTIKIGGASPTVWQTLNFIASVYFSWTNKPVEPRPQTCQGSIKVLSNAGNELETTGIVKLITVFNSQGMGGAGTIELLIGIDSTVSTQLDVFTVRLYKNNMSQLGPLNRYNADWELHPDLNPAITTGFPADIGITWFITSSGGTGLTDLSLNIMRTTPGMPNNDNSAWSTFNEHFMAQTYFGGDKNVIMDIPLLARKGAIITDISTNNVEVSGKNIIMRDNINDPSYVYIGIDENNLLYNAVKSNIATDGSNNLILQSKDGGVVIDAHTKKGTGGGLKIFNSGETVDKMNYTWPKIDLVPYDEDANPGGTGALAGVSTWQTGPGGFTSLEGAQSFGIFSGKEQNTQFNFYVGDSSSKSATTAIHMGCVKNDSSYPSDWKISLNDNGGSSTRNNVSTYINTPSYHIYNTPKNPALHVDSNDDNVKFNAPLLINGGIQGTVDISNINVNTSAILPTNTIITNRSYGGTHAISRTLTADGYKEFKFDTTAINANDWITIARVGPLNMTQSAQRADAEFEFINNTSSCHQTIRLRASHHFARGQTLDVIQNVRYGNGTHRQIKAFRMRYGNTYDGGILQMQIGNNSTSGADDIIRLKVYHNNNYYGWVLNIPDSPAADNSPLMYSKAPGSTWDTLGGSFQNMSISFPSASGVNVLERLAANPGYSTLMYTSDMELNKIYIKDTLDMSSNNVVGLNNLYRDSNNKQPITIGSNGAPGVGNTILKSIQFTEPIRLINNYGTLDLRDYLNYLNTDGLLGYDKDKDFIMTTEAGDQKYLSAPSTIEFIIPLNQVTWYPNSVNAQWTYPTKSQRQIFAGKDVPDIICGSGVGNTMFSGASAANNGFNPGMGGQYFCPFVSPHDGILTGATLYPFSDGRYNYLTTDRSIGGSSNRYDFDIEVWICEVTPSSGNISKAGLILNNCPGVVAAKGGTEGTTSKKLFTYPHTANSSSISYPFGTLPSTYALQADNSFKIIKDKQYMIISLERRKTSNWPSGGTMTFTLSSNSSNGGYLQSTAWSCSTNPIKVDLQIIFRAPA